MKGLITLLSLAVIVFLFGDQVYAQDARKVKVCFGTEPFWDIQFTVKKIKFKDIEGNTMTISRHVPRTAVGSSPDFIALYQGKLQEDSQRFMNLIIKLNKCSDGMSDEVHPFEVFVLSGNTLFHGCCR